MSFEADAGTVPVAETTPIAPATTEAPPAPEGTPSPETPSPRDSMEAVWEKHNPARGSDGKFASREQSPTEAPATDEQTQEFTPETPADNTAVETGDPETTDQPEEPTSAEPEAPAIDAPHSWSAEHKAKWNELPPDLQRYIADRESEAHKRITQQGTLVKAIEPFAHVLGEYQDDFKQHGVTPAQGISYLLARNRQFMSDPVAALKDLAKIAGVDLTQLDEPAEQQIEQPEQNPELLELRREIGELKSTMTAAQRAQYESNLAAASRDLAAFGQDKPYFNEPGVQPLMGVLMQSGRATTLQQAYDMAVYADPELRQRILDDQRKGEETKRAAEEAKRAQDAAAEAKRKKAEAEKAAAEARKAASVNVRSGAGASPTPPKSLRESMEEVADQLMS